MRCHTPEIAYNKLWEFACYNEWYTNAKKMNMVERIWTITMVILINLTILFCSVTVIKRWFRYRKDLQLEEQRQEIVETTQSLYVLFISIKKKISHFL